MQTNPQLDLAYEFVQNTNRNVFLTGKAGTGKTTFLHTLKSKTPKRMVIVAPTGVAAINAGGVTIHSFFQLPFSPHIPITNEEPDIFNEPKKATQGGFQQKFNRQKIHLIKSIDLLVIDEISMVRADMLDAIDETLRRYKDHSKPFGGVQLLMIGDLLQLAPVIKDEEWNLLRKYYDSVYFFSSRALIQTQFVSIELKHIFRQSDHEFIGILNKVRDNKLDETTLNKLNSRYIENFSPEDKDGYITLTTHNAIAHETNQNKLLQIKGKIKSFEAVIKDDFPKYSYPTEEILELKVGAQVMFVKNDPNPGKEFYNGKIGKITKIEEEVIFVKCPSDEEEISVTAVEWENVKYTLNEETKEIKEEKIGVFKQFPLKLAWAITIHKSQGLTFEKAIIDANAAFAHGQVYVALSRCKTFEGLVLSSKINPRGIKTDGTVSGFTENVEQNPPDENQLLESKINYQQSLLKELFSFGSIQMRLNYFKRIVGDANNRIDKSVMDEIVKLETITNPEIHVVAEKFKNQISQILIENPLPETNTELQERVKKASVYFLEKTENIFLKYTKEVAVITDNKEVRKLVNDNLERLQREIITKIGGLKSSLSGFDPMKYLHSKANADIDYKASLKTKDETRITTPKNIAHPKLYVQLREWRESIAIEQDIDPYMVLQQKTMNDLVELMPVTLRQLKAIKGIGKAKLAEFGDELIEIISDYCLESGIIEEKRIELPIEKPKVVKGDSKLISFELYKGGKSISEIAKERAMAISTIEGHLVQYVGYDGLNIEDFVDSKTIEKIMKLLNENPETTMNEIFTKFNSTVSYSQIRFVLKKFMLEK